MSVQHFWNLSWLLELFPCCKLANLSWKFVTATSKQCTKTTGHWPQCKKLCHWCISRAYWHCWNSKWWSLYERHNKREDFLLTLYGVWKETAVCSNAGTCLIVRAGHDRRHKNVLTFDFEWIWTFHHEQSCLVNCKTRERRAERNLLRCCFRL